MYYTEDIVSKFIITTDGEKEFQVRFIRDEGVGILTTSTNKSYFLLDSADYWYDLIQEKYPSVMKCSCKNEIFNVILDYTPRVGTEDFKEISITCRCTVCQKFKRLSTIDIDYSPSSHLFENPISFCEFPKLKYKTYSLMEYWSEKELLNIAEYFVENNLFIYCWYWNFQTDKRCFREISATELYAFLTGDKGRYIAIYFCEEKLNDVSKWTSFDDNGVLICQNIWRKECLFVLNSPISVMSYGLLYQLHFCSEYLDKHGKIVSKSNSFCALVKEFHKISKKIIKE